jgi:hypothetical protein
MLGGLAMVTVGSVSYVALISRTTTYRPALFYTQASNILLCKTS